MVKLSDFTVWRHTWRKSWVNCAVLTGNSAGLRTVFSCRLSHRELRSSLRKSHSLLSLPADTTMASSQGTSVSSNSFSRSASHDIILFKYHFLFHILHFLFFFSDNMMADVASKQQMTAFFFLSQSHAQEDTQNWPKKTWKTWWENCVVSENIQFSFRAVFLYTVDLRVYGAL
jgi:nitric oxide reductase large subunit